MDDGLHGGVYEKITEKYGALDRPADEDDAEETDFPFYASDYLLKDVLGKVEVIPRSQGHHAMLPREHEDQDSPNAYIKYPRVDHGDPDNPSVPVRWSEQSERVGEINRLTADRRRKEFLRDQVADIADSASWFSPDKEVDRYLFGKLPGSRFVNGEHLLADGTIPTLPSIVEDHPYHSETQRMGGIGDLDVKCVVRPDARGYGKNLSTTETSSFQTQRKKMEEDVRRLTPSELARDQKQVAEDLFHPYRQGTLRQKEKSMIRNIIIPPRSSADSTAPLAWVTPSPALADGYFMRGKEPKECFVSERPVSADIGDDALERQQTVSRARFADDKYMTRIPYARELAATRNSDN